MHCAAALSRCVPVHDASGDWSETEDHGREALAFLHQIGART